MHAVRIPKANRRQASESDRDKDHANRKRFACAVIVLSFLTDALRNHLCLSLSLAIAIALASNAVDVYISLLFVDTHEWSVNEETE